MKYRKKPIVVEAMQFWPFLEIQTDLEKFMEFCEEKAVMAWSCTDGMHLKIKTLEGTMIANQGDYIIKGVRGEVYPCKRDIFEETYVEVHENDVQN